MVVVVMVVVVMLTVLVMLVLIKAYIDQDMEAVGLTSLNENQPNS